MKQYRLIKIGNHYVAVARANAKPERSLEQFAELITKGDRIRNMDDEELAWELMTWRFDAYGDGAGYAPSILPRSQAAIVKWLKERA